MSGWVECEVPSRRRQLAVQFGAQRACRQRAAAQSFNTHELKHCDDFGSGRPITKGVAYMDAGTHLVQMVRRHIDGDVDEFLVLRLEYPVLPRVGGVRGVSLEEIGAAAQRLIPTRTPVAACSNESLLQRLLTGF